MPTAALELSLRRLPDGSLHADARLSSDASAASTTLAANVPVALDAAALRGLEGSAEDYGRQLSTQLFADQRLREAWLKARASAESGALQLRLRLDASADALHALRWETLRDPESDQPIALSERVRLVRYLDSASLTPVVVPPRPDLRALLVVANPHDLADYRLAEVDVDGEVGRARAALGAIPTTILGDHAEAEGRATLVNIAAQMRAAPPLVILVAHGTLADDAPIIWLEQDDGSADKLPGAELITTIEQLTARPLLFILASCRSAGGGYDGALSALGPGLARIGVPAVLGFQGDVAMSTVKTMLPALLGELLRDGQIDRALAAARAALGPKRPWWQAVLWLRTDGWLWAEPQDEPNQPSQTINNHAPNQGAQGNFYGPVTFNQQGALAQPSAPSDPAKSLLQQLEAQRETLAHQLLQLARLGSAYAPPGTTAGIREARREIDRIKAKLLSLGVQAADHPDDQE